MPRCVAMELCSLPRQHSPLTLIIYLAVSHWIMILWGRTILCWRQTQHSTLSSQWGHICRIKYNALNYQKTNTEQAGICAVSQETEKSNWSSRPGCGWTQETETSGLVCLDEVWVELGQGQGEHTPLEVLLRPDEHFAEQSSPPALLVQAWVVSIYPVGIDSFQVIQRESFSWNCLENGASPQDGHIHSNDFSLSCCVFVSRCNNNALWNMYTGFPWRRSWFFHTYWAQFPHFSSFSPRVWVLQETH